jgi:sugar lactone lactonase YvrE
MRRSLLLGALVALTITGLAAAGGGNFPSRIDLPNGWQPEGIAITNQTFYVGSIPTGAIYRGNLRSGNGAILIPAQAGRQAIGVESDGKGRLFVAGGETGDGYVYNARTGTTISTYDFASGPDPTFVNDVVATRGGAYFTDSNRPVLYRVPLTRNGEPGPTSQEVELSGDYVHGGGFNVNGIDATKNGKWLVIVQSGTGKLFRVNPGTGVAREIDLGGTALTNGDGLLLDGRTLYVVRNQLNRIAVVRVAQNLLSGSVVRELTSTGFAVPTTIDDFGRRLYAVNARFGTMPTPDTEYWLTQVRKSRGS